MSHAVTVTSGYVVSELVDIQALGLTFPRKPSFTTPGLLGITKEKHHLQVANNVTFLSQV